ARCGPGRGRGAPGWLAARAGGGGRGGPPPLATEEDVLRIHAPVYVATVKRFSAEPALASGWDAAQWGLAPGGDTPARAGMHEAALAVCGASLTAADLVWRGEADAVYCPAPAGLHHALANRASGFCVY